MTDQWHSLRRQHIGGSEIAGLFGESPYADASPFTLWHIKHGSIEPRSLDDDERVQAGRFQEPAAIAWANWKWKTNFYAPKVYVKHKTVKGMGCTPDCFSADEGIVASSKIAQIKIVDSIQFAREWESEGDVITRAPLHILLQVQHEMECCGAGECWLIVMVGGNRLLYMICKPDADVADMIRTKVRLFWSEPCPSPDYLNDGAAIRTLRGKLPTCESIDLSDDSDLHNLISSLGIAMYQRKIYNDKEQSMKNKLIHLYGEYERIKCKEFTATIKPDVNGHIRVWFGTEKVTF